MAVCEKETPTHHDEPHPMLKTILLLLTLTSTLYAETAIQEVKVRRVGADVNIRVVVVNPGARAQRGPVLVDLYVRDTEGQPWQKIKSWRNIHRIKPGEKVARDFFEENNATLRALAADGAFQARAVVRAPGAQDSESVFSWQDTQ